MLRMTRKRLSAIVSLLVLLGAQVPLRAYTLQYRDSSGIVTRRWLTHPVIIAFSASLVSPPANIKSGSDVLGAARRAMQHWASVADIEFLETSSSLQNISPQNGGDRINLITVSDQNSALFRSTNNAERPTGVYRRSSSSSQPTSCGRISTRVAGWKTFLGRSSNTAGYGS